MKKVDVYGATFNVSGEPAGFWDQLSSDKWEAATFRAIASQLRSDTIFFDPVKEHFLH